MRRRSKRIAEAFRRPKGRNKASDSRPMTAVTFDVEELNALAEYMAAGLVLLRVTKPHRGLAKFKAAMSRLKTTPPRGL